MIYSAALFKALFDDTISKNHAYSTRKATGRQYGE
jgi:hypothetical protein